MIASSLERPNAERPAVTVSDISDNTLHYTRAPSMITSMNTKKFSGSILILTSALFYGTYGIWARLMTGHFNEFSQAWIRGLALFVFVLLANLKYRFIKPIRKEDMKWFVVIALCGGLNQAPYFFGFEHLSIGTATLLFYAALVVGGYLLGKVFFKEKMTMVKIASLVVALFGIYIIYGFTLTSQQVLPATFTVLAGLMGAATVVLPKKLTDNYNELQIMAGYFSFQVLINLPLALLLHDAVPSLALAIPWLAQLGYAVTMLCANAAAIAGFSKLEPSIGSLLGLAEILFGIIFGVVLFAEPLRAGVIIGGTLIIISAALPSLQELIVEKRKRS